MCSLIREEGLLGWMHRSVQIGSSWNDLHRVSAVATRDEEAEETDRPNRWANARDRPLDVLADGARIVLPPPLNKPILGRGELSFSLSALGDGLKVASIIAVFGFQFFSNARDIAAKAPGER
jgi:hypothetical protein